MPKFPALPLWTDAYLADTRHLTTLEHGAYLLILMEMWRRKDCMLPDDDKLLARLTGLTPDEWEDVKLVIIPMLQHDKRNRKFKHERLLRERRFVEEKSRQNRDAALTRWKGKKKRHTNADANAVQTKCQNDAPTPTPNKPLNPLTESEKFDRVKSWLDNTSGVIPEWVNTAENVALLKADGWTDADLRERGFTK